VLRDGLHERVTLMYQILRDYLRMGVRLLDEFRTMRTDPIEQKLGKIDHPTLLVRGEHDAIASREWLYRAAGLIGARARVIELPGAAHAANYSVPDRLVEAIVDFLREAPGQIQPRT
jgi:pimeloyl-ACP methyl ester carboxylesterase